MSFVNPIFFAGMLAAGIPILLHMIRRERSRIIEFPTLMFLRRISKKTIRYQKLRHLLLLLMRVAALLFLAGGFLRPFLPISPSAGAAGNPATAHIILLDNSLSMGYGDRWDRARKAAIDLALACRQGDQASLIEFSDEASVRVPLTMQPGLVAEDVRNGTRLTDRPTRYAPALKAAEKIALDAGAVKRVIHLLTDFQKSGWAADEQEFKLAPGIALEYRDFGSESFSNLTIGDVRIDDVTPGVDRGPRIRFSVINFGIEARKGVHLRLMLEGRLVQEKWTDLAASEVQAGEFQLPGLTSGAHPVVIEVEDSRLTLDNRYCLMLEIKGRTRVLSVEDSAAGPGARTASYFIERALNIAGLSPYELTSTPLGRLESMGNISASTVIWNNAPAGSAAVQKKLQDFINRGGGLLVVASDGRRAAEFNRTFGAWLPVTIAPEESGSRRDSDTFVLMTNLKAEHPIFRLFHEPHSGSFSGARFYRHARLRPLQGAEVLARFDNGDPALVSISKEKGRVLIFASSADDSANDLPLKAVFPAFWQQMLRHLGQIGEGGASVEVGSTIAPRRSILDAAFRQGLTGPDSAQVMVLLDPSKQRVAIPPGGDSVRVDKAGFYEARMAGLGASIAVNPVPRESDLTRGNAEEMVAGWASSDPAASGGQAGDERASPEEQDRRSRYWRILLAGVLLFLAADAILANRLAVVQDL